MTFRIAAKNETHNDAIVAAWVRNYGDTMVVSRGQVHDARLLPGFVAEESGALLGAVTYHREGDAFEVVSLDSLAENRGVGTALLDAAVQLARQSGARRAWLITSNDNIRAIRFYQRRGWNMAALHVDAVTAARKIKPRIPLLGDDDIPVRHEIEFELILR